MKIKNFMKIKIKKGDNVMIISGKDRGKKGVVEKVIPKIGKITVIGINITKHHLKPSRKNPHGGIVDKLAPIDISNCLIVCPRCNRPTRVSYKLTNKQKSRICRHCQESLDV